MRIRNIVYKKNTNSKTYCNESDIVISSSETFKCTKFINILPFFREHLHKPQFLFCPIKVDHIKINIFEHLVNIIYFLIKIHFNFCCCCSLLACRNSCTKCEHTVDINSIESMRESARKVFCSSFE